MTLFKTIFLILFSLSPCLLFAEIDAVTENSLLFEQKYSQIHIDYRLWQESIEASSSGSTSNLLAHFHGVHFGYSRNYPLKNADWVYLYGVEYGMGVTKGIASLPLTDEIDDQPWFSATIYPGLIYRTTSHSELGVLLPFTFRRIQWDVKPPFELDKENSFSLGITALYINRFNWNNSIVISLSHQQMWNSTIFGIGYLYDFR